MPVRVLVPVHSHLHRRVATVSQHTYPGAVPALRAARLIAEKKMGPVILVFPDCFTALDGNQYVNFSAIDNYALGCPHDTGFRRS